MLKEIMLVRTCNIEVFASKSDFIQGDIIKGIVKLKCGKKRYKVRGVSLTFYVDYFTEGMEKYRVKLYTTQISDGFVTYPYDEREISFQHNLSLNTPITTNFLIVIVEAKMDVVNFIPATSEKIITVNPYIETQFILKALQYDFNFQPSYRSGLFYNNQQYFEFRDIDTYRNYGLDRLMFYMEYDHYYIYTHFYFNISGHTIYKSMSLYRSQLYKFDHTINEEYIKDQIYLIISESINYK